MPDKAHEAMRDLVRMRALAKRDQRWARQQLQSFLRRHGRDYSGSSWSKAHRGWLADHGNPRHGDLATLRGERNGRDGNQHRGD